MNRSNTAYVTSTQIGAFNGKYHLTVDLVGSRIVVTTVLKWGTIQSGISAADQAKIQAAFTTTTAGRWSGKAKLKIEDSTCSPKSKTLPIDFKILWDKASKISPHFSVNLKKGPARSNVTGSVINIDTLDLNNNAYTVSHEYGHTLGLHDEYRYVAATAASVTYKRADGTTSTLALTQPANHMSVSGDFTFLDRFFYFLEIEVQELLRSSKGLKKAGITCTIV